MPHEMKLVLDEDKEELACLNSQRKIVGQTFRTVIEIENHNFILIKDEEAVSQRGFISNKEEESYKYEIEAVMSQAKGKSVLEVEKTELTIRTSQEAEGQQWSVVKEEEKSYVETIIQHTKEVLEGNQVISEWLSSLLK